jgi:hypothetical protein
VTSTPSPIDHRPIRHRRTATTTRAAAAVLVISARGDVRGARAAEACAATLRTSGPDAAPVVATHAGAPDLAERISAAARVYVLDPGRVRAWRERRRHSPLAAPARAADRLALLRLLRDHQVRTRWVSSPRQLPAARVD